MSTISGLPLQPEESERQQQAAQDQAVSWLDEHWQGARKCPICGHQDWAVGELIYHQLVNYGGVVVSYRIMVPVTCTTCFYTWQFDGHKSGVIRMGRSDAVDLGGDRP
jgi:hypothetical protein